MMHRMTAWKDCSTAHLAIRRARRNSSSVPLRQLPSVRQARAPAQTTGYGFPEAVQTFQGLHRPILLVETSEAAVVQVHL